MRLTILLLFITFSPSSFSQHVITDSTFYDGAKLRYDSLNKYWRYYKFYESGKIESTRKLDPIRYWDVDTSIVYHRNGKVAWIFPYTDSGYLTGKLIGYYQDGSIKREAYYYRGFRTGTWKEYYQNGKTKNISHYEITSADSVYNNWSSENEKIAVFENEYFIWGEHNDTTVYNGMVVGPVKYAMPTLISKKTGKWETYDSTGKLRGKRLTDFDSTYMVKKLIGWYELSFETVKEIYEKCNSFEELAQMLQKNDDKYNMTEFLKNWHEANAGFLEALNEPRLALGLRRLTFKEEPKEKIQKP